MVKKKIVLRILIPLIFIGGIFSIYEASSDAFIVSGKPKILDEKNFNANLLGDESSKDLILDKVENIPVPWITKSMEVLDNNNVMFSIRYANGTAVNVSDKKESYFQLGTLNLRNKDISRFNAVDGINQYIVSISPDKKSLLYRETNTLANKDNLRYAQRSDYIDDLKSKNIIPLSYWEFLNWMPDSSSFIGLSSELYIYDINDESKSVILTSAEVRKLGSMKEIQATKDGSKIYVKTSNPKSKFDSNVACISLKDKSITFLNIKGVVSFKLLDSENVIYTRLINDKNQLYIYNLKSDKSKLLVDEDIPYFVISSNCKSIAYVKKDDRGRETLCAAKIRGDSINSNIMLYKDILIKDDDIQWSSDNQKLYVCLREGSKLKDKDYLYIFTFK
ncbi:MAG: hypothetical protein Q8936_16280 [Bacillota bacterium]|nr:hypothetical protein [Bacillota bacterium]